MHLVLHLPDEVEPPPPAGLNTIFSRGHRNSPHRSVRPTLCGHAQNLMSTATRLVGCVSSPRCGSRPGEHTPQCARPVEPVEAGDLVVRDVKLDVPDPEAEAAVSRDVDAPDGVVPELRGGEEVAYGDADDGVVGADGDGAQEDCKRERLEEEAAQLER